ncbi:MAG: DUF4394 domain-containing protein [Opitutaceae bacterium]|nr:DUF4394 domain-containing protein [Opitutaceae bacterium]MBP9902451.1 DUF4394 domain-containing protein [Verrucomicrobiota bacterium]
MKSSSCVAKLLIALLGITGGTVLSAQVLITVNDANDTLQWIDPHTLTFTNIGPLGVAYDFGDLTWNPNTSTLYMIDGRAARGLYTVNPFTGSTTLIGVHGITDLFGLAYNTANDTLYAASFQTNTLYTLNPATGAATVVGSTSVSLGALAYDSQQGILIGAQDGSGNLYQVNITTGATTLLASAGYTNDSGLTFDPSQNRLLDIDWSGNLFSYDIANGYARTTLLTGLDSHDGLIYIESIPEPGTVSLLLAGLGLLGFRWFRQRARK